MNKHTMLLKKKTLIYITILLSFIFNGANALQCTHMSAKVIAQCKNSICDELFVVNEIKSIDPCARRPIVIAPPKWAKSVVEYEVKANNFRNDEALYELVIRKSFYSQMQRFTNAHEYIELIEEKEIGYSPFRRFRKLDETSFESVKQQWKSKERNKYISDILWKLAEWSSLIVCFVLLLFSIHWFDQWVNGTKKMKWLLISIIIQSLIMYLAVMALTGWTYNKIALFGLLIPGIWFYQLVLLCSSGIRRGKSLTDNGKM